MVLFLKFVFAQNPVAPFPYVFQQIGWIEIKWIVTIGGIFALCTNILGAMFPLPRVLYAMASDGILFKHLRKIDKRTQTPVFATIIAGFFSATMALIFDLNQLIDMMSIGTLIAYTIVSICVLILRYECDEVANNIETHSTNAQIVRQLVNASALKHPTKLSSQVTKYSIIAYSICVIFLCSLSKLVGTIDNGGIWDFLIPIAMAVVAAAMLLLVLIMNRQPLSDVALTFKVPLVPWIPCLSVLINLYLMFQLDLQTWIRFAIWGAVGKLESQCHKPLIPT